MQKQFSQYFRNQRCYSVSQNSAERNPLNSASKKAKFSHGDDAEAQKRNLELLRDAKEGALSNKTYKSLIEDTFHERRKLIQITAQSSADVLTMCPYLAKSKIVSF